jgi:hypothetical protein
MSPSGLVALEQTSRMTVTCKSNDSVNYRAKTPIHITSQDKQRLEDLVAEVAFSDPRRHGDLNALLQELERAVIVDPKQIPDDVITMNSRAELIDLETAKN